MAEKKKSDILKGTMAEEFKKESRPWYEKAWEGVTDVASDIGSGIKSGLDYIGEAGEGVGSRLGPLPGSEKEKKKKEAGEQRLEDIRATKLEDITSLAEDIAQKRGTTLEESPELQEAVREKAVEEFGEEAAAKLVPEPLPGQRPLTEKQAQVQEGYEPKAIEEPAADQEPIDEEPEDPAMKQSADAVDTMRQINLGDMTELALKDNQIREEYLNELAEAKEMYARTKDEIAQKKIWEALLNGIGALATAWYGRNTGLDLSGVKFSPSDWDSKLDQARQDLAVAKSFAKDVRDVKLEGTEAERNRMIREMQGDKAFNDAVYDKLKYEVLKKQKDAMDASDNSLAALEQQKKVFDQVKGTPQYKVYAENKSALEKVLQEYKKNPDDNTLEELRSRSKSLQAAADGVASLGVNFPNEYPPSIFEDKDVTRLIIFPGKASPEFLDILSGKEDIDFTKNLPEKEQKLYLGYSKLSPESKKVVRGYFLKNYNRDLEKR